MKTSRIALRLSLLIPLFLAGACKPPDNGAALLDAGTVEDPGMPFPLATTYKASATGGGVYQIDLVGLRSAAGGATGGWRLSQTLPAFKKPLGAVYLKAGEPIRLQFEMVFTRDEPGSTDASARKVCGGDKKNPGGIELRATRFGQINCDPELQSTLEPSGNAATESKGDTGSATATDTDVEPDTPDQAPVGISTEASQHQANPSAVVEPTAGEQKWCDSAGACLPYCTTAADSGNGFGTEPQLGGAGGTCKVKGVTGADAAGATGQ